MNSLSDLGTVGGQQMMRHIWDGPQHHVTMLMLTQVHEIMRSNRRLTVQEIAESATYP
jgi:hypothetical protein